MSHSLNKLTIKDYVLYGTARTEEYINLKGTREVKYFYDNIFPNSTFAGTSLKRAPKHLMKALMFNMVR